jgi:hypothetical protein
MKPNISSVVDNNENLFRAIKILPQLWDDEFNRPSSAAFKDSKGLSVDRNAERSFDEVITCLKKHFSNLKGVAYFTASSCKNIDLIILYCPTPDDLYHCEIHQSDTCIPLSKASARKLSKLAFFKEV